MPRPRVNRSVSAATLTSKEFMVDPFSSSGRHSVRSYRQPRHTRTDIRTMWSSDFRTLETRRSRRCEV